MRHNEIRDITANMLNEVCEDVRIEPPLIELENEALNHQASRSNEARLDVSAIGFWTAGQKAFYDIRVFDHNALQYSRTETKKCFQRNEDEKQKTYNQRVLQVENATFTPLVFSTNGGMGENVTSSTVDLLR